MSPIKLSKTAKSVLLLILFLLPLAVAADEKDTGKEPKVQRVAMFGCAISFTDSLVCMTDIQTIDSAWIEPAHKFLIDRSLYSLQLQMYMEQQGHKNAICTIFYDKKPRKVQRMWRKVYKRTQKHDGLRYQNIPVSAFRMKAEEYRPIIMEDSAQ